MLYVEALEVPVKVRLKLWSAICLNNEDSERQSTNNLIDKLDSSFLIAAVIDFKNSDSGAIVNSSKLI